MARERSPWLPAPMQEYPRVGVGMRILQIVLSLLVAMAVFSGVASAAGRAATESLFVFGNLDPSAPEGSVVVTRARIVDSIGERHEITFTFTRVPGGNAWHWEASSTDPIITTPDPLADGTLV